MFLLLFAPSIHAATLSGTIYSPTDEFASGYNISITQQSIVLNTTTNGSGYYNFTGLNEGDAYYFKLATGYWNYPFLSFFTDLSSVELINVTGNTTIDLTAYKATFVSSLPVIASDHQNGSLINVTINITNLDTIDVENYSIIFELHNDNGTEMLTDSILEGLTLLASTTQNYSIALTVPNNATEGVADLVLQVEQMQNITDNWGNYSLLQSRNITSRSITINTTSPPVPDMPPNISVLLEEPLDGSVLVNDTNVSFIFNVTSDEDSSFNVSCDFWTNASGSWTNSSGFIDITNLAANTTNISQSFWNESLGLAGSYTWNVRCWDENNLSNYAFAATNRTYNVTEPIAGIASELFNYTVQKTLMSGDPATVGDMNISFLINITNIGGTNLSTIYVNDTFDGAEIAYNYSSLTYTTLGVDSIVWDNLTNISGIEMLEPDNSILLTVNFSAIAATADTVNMVFVNASDEVGNESTSILNATANLGIVDLPGNFTPAAILINLLQPMNLFVTDNATNITFEFNVTSARENDYRVDCGLWWNVSGVWNHSGQSNITNLLANTTNLSEDSWNLTVSVPGDYEWNVYCFNATNSSEFAFAAQNNTFNVSDAGAPEMPVMINITLTQPLDNAVSDNETNISFMFDVTSDAMSAFNVNCSFWWNVSGVWADSGFENKTGLDANMTMMTTEFWNVTVPAVESYEWNVLCWDDANASEFAWAQQNRTFNITAAAIAQTEGTNITVDKSCNATVNVSDTIECLVNITSSDINNMTEVWLYDDHDFAFLNFTNQSTCPVHNYSNSPGVDGSYVNVNLTSCYGGFNLTLGNSFLVYLNFTALSGLGNETMNMVNVTFQSTNGSTFYLNASTLIMVMNDSGGMPPSESSALIVNKSILNSGNFTEGDNITYHINVTNNHSMLNMTSIFVNDTFQVSQLEYLDANVTNTSGASNFASWNDIINLAGIGSLEAGQSLSMYVNFTIVINTGEFTNTVTVNGTLESGFSEENSSTVTASAGDAGGESPTMGNYTPMWNEAKYAQNVTIDDFDFFGAPYVARDKGCGGQMQEENTSAVAGQNCHNDGMMNPSADGSIALDLGAVWVDETYDFMAWKLKGPFSDPNYHNLSVCGGNTSYAAYVVEFDVDDNISTGCSTSNMSEGCYPGSDFQIWYFPDDHNSLFAYYNGSEPSAWGPNDGGACVDGICFVANTSVNVSMNVSCTGEGITIVVNKTDLLIANPALNFETNSFNVTQATTNPIDMLTNWGGSGFIEAFFFTGPQEDVGSCFQFDNNEQGCINASDNFYCVWQDFGGGNGLCDPDFNNFQEGQACFTYDNQTACENSDIGYCEWLTNVPDPDNPGQTQNICVEQFNPFLISGGGDCDTKCFDCFSQTQCENSNANGGSEYGGCEWYIDPFNQVGFCEAKGMKFGCAENPRDCFNQTGCTDANWHWNNTWMLCAEDSLTEICFNGVDDNGDGQIDCSDNDCFEEKECGGQLNTLTGDYQGMSAEEAIMSYFFGTGDPNIIHLKDDNASENIGDLFNLTSFKVVVGPRGIGMGIGLQNMSTLSACGGSIDDHKYIYALDTDANSSSGCNLTIDGTQKEGYEYIVKYGNFSVANESGQEMYLYHCLLDQWLLKPGLVVTPPAGEDLDPGEPAIMECQTLATTPDEGAVAAVIIDKADIGNPKEDMRFFVMVANVSYNGGWNNLSNLSAVDLIENIYYTPGTIGAEPIDCFQEPTKCGAGFMQIGGGEFMPFEDCLGSGDEDIDDLVNCADPDCFFAPHCQGSQDLFDVSSDVTAPTITLAKADTFDDAAFISWTNNEPTNGSLRFYHNDSACSTLNITIIDEGLPGSFDDFKPWHGVPLDPMSLSYSLSASTTYYYKIYSTDRADNIGVSACLNFTTLGSPQNLSMVINFTPPVNDTGDFLGNLSMDLNGEPFQIDNTNSKESLFDANITLYNPSANASKNWSIELIEADIFQDMVFDFSSALLANDSGDHDENIGMDGYSWMNIAQKFGVEYIIIKIPNNGETLYHCQDNGTNCTDVTSTNGVELLETTADYTKWKIPTTLGFSTYSAGGSTNETFNLTYANLTTTTQTINTSQNTFYLVNVTNNDNVTRGYNFSLEISGSVDWAINNSAGLNNIVFAVNESQVLNVSMNSTTEGTYAFNIIGINATNASIVLNSSEDLTLTLVVTNCFRPSNSTTVVLNESTTLCAGTYNKTRFQFNADNITLDCNGAILDGQNTTSYAVQVPNGIDGTTLKNCNITRYDNAYETQFIGDPAAYDYVINNTFEENEYGVYHVNNYLVMIINNTFYDNEWGIHWGNNDFGLIQNNNFTRHNYSAIEFDSSSVIRHAAIVDNYFEENALKGWQNAIEIDGQPEDILIHNNTFINNNNSNIQASSSFAMVRFNITNNYISNVKNGTTRNAITLYDVQNFYIAHNTLLNVNGSGIYASSGTNANITIYNNTIKHGGLTSTSAGISFVIGVYNSTITDNFVENFSYPIYLYGYSGDNVVYNNIFNLSVNPAYNGNSTNQFNTTLNCSSTNIIGGSCYGGNYWANATSGQGFSQSCTDADRDGICDSTYNISGVVDYHPLTNVGNDTYSDPYEYDDVYTSAKGVFTDGTWQFHNLSNASDIDWVNFSASDEEAYLIDTTNFSVTGTGAGQLDLYMTIYNASMTALETNDDANSGTSNARIKFIAPYDGIFYVKVQDYDSTKTYGNLSYAIQVEKQGRLVVVPVSHAAQSSSNYTLHTTFNVTTAVTCQGGPCREVVAILDPEPKINKKILDDIEKKGKANVIIKLKEKEEKKEPFFGIFASDKDVKEEFLDSINTRKLGEEEPQGFFAGVARALGIEQEPDLIVQHTYDVVDAVSGEITSESIEALLENDLIESIEYSVPVFASLFDTVDLINASTMQNYAINSTYMNGTGVTVCVIDSGINYTHPDFGSCSLTSDINDGSCPTVIGGINYCVDEACTSTDMNPIDTYGHGSHVAGIIASRDATYTGVAPGAKIVAVKALNSSGQASDFSNILAGINYCVANATTYNISVITMSLGSTVYTQHFCDEDYSSTRDAIQSAIDAGIMVVIASGNENKGYDDPLGISYPACIRNATSVGSTTKADAVSTFTNRAYTLDLMAPGGSIGATDYDGTHVSMSGTSMATPHVSGAAAIMQQYARELYDRNITALDIETRLRMFGVNIADSNSGLTYARIDVDNATLGKGIIPNTTGAVPFYIVADAGHAMQNPFWIGTMSDGETINTSWMVNATGNFTAYEFFSIYQSDFYESNTSHWEINITDMPNTPPYRNISPVTSANEDTLYYNDVQGLDNESHSISYSLNLIPTDSNASIDTNGSITWTPDNDDAAIQNYTFNLTLTDQLGDSSNYQYNVTVSNVNDAPTITSSPTSTATENTLYTYNATATDIDPTNDTMTYALQINDTNASMNSSGHFELYVNSTEVGITYNFTINVTDGNGGWDNQTWNVTVEDVNDAITISTTPNYNATEDALYHYDVNYTDPDTPDDDVSFYLTTYPTGMIINISDGNITWTPDNDDIGNNTVVVFAVENSTSEHYNDTHTFGVWVANTNDAPSINVTPNASATEDSLYTSTFTASDVDPTNDTMSYYLQSNTTNATINSSSGIFYFFPLQADVNIMHNFTVNVTDGNAGWDSLDFNITTSNVNDAPVISTAATTRSAEEETEFWLDVDATDEDSDTLTYSISTYPTSMVINSSTGNITWTPTNTQAIAYTHAVVVNVSDGNGGEDTLSFNVTVNNTNDIPVLNSTHNTTAIEDLEYTYLFSMNDSDNKSDSWNYTLISGPGNMTIGLDSGLIQFSPNNYDAINGSYIININVTEYNSSGANMSYQNISFNLTITNVNDAPSFTNEPSGQQSVLEDSAYNYDFDATDLDPTSDTLTYSLNISVSTNISAVTVGSSNGNLTWTPTNDEVGTITLQVDVSDGNGGSDNVTFTVLVNNTNDAPVISTTSPTSVATQGSEYTQQINASDADSGDSIMYQLNVSPSGMSMNDTGYITWTPNSTHGGNTYSVTVVVNDTSNAQDNLSWDITVNDVNDPPNITSSPSVNATEDVSYTYNVIATDPENDTLSYYLTIYPSGMTVTISTGQVSWTPTNSDIGFNNVTLQVIENATADHYSTTQNWSVYVSNVNDAPVLSGIPDQSFAEDSSSNVSINLSAYASDSDGDTLTYAIQSESNEGLVNCSVNSTTTLITCTDPSANENGASTVVANVTDGTSWDTDTFTITVTSVNDVPTFTDVPNTTITLTQDVAYSFDVNATDNDTNDTVADVLNYYDNTSLFNINPSTGIISFTPSSDDIGNHSVLIWTTDQSSANDTYAFTVTVQDANDAPTGTPIPNMQWNEDTNASINLSEYFTDADGDVLNFTAAVHNDTQNITITINNETGIALLVSAANWYGKRNVTFNASDPSAAVASIYVNLTVSSVNDLPVVAVSNISLQEDSAVQFINISGNVSDVDQSDLTAIVWAIDSSNTFSADLGTAQIINNTYLRIALTANAFGNDTIRLKATDTPGGSGYQTLLINVTGVNDAPSTPTIVIQPSAPTPTDDLTCSRTQNATDIDEDTIVYFIDWYKDGVLQTSYTNTSTVSSAATSSDELWSCVMTAFDGTVNGTAANTSTTIGNNPPTIPTIAFTPSLPYTSDMLYCNVTTNSTDADNDSIDYLYEFYKDNILNFTNQTNVTYAPLPSALTAKGEVWKCSVRAYDNKSYSNSTSSTRTIINTEPVVTVNSPVSGTPSVVEPDYQEFNLSVYDADNDFISFTWTKDAVQMVENNSNETFSSYSYYNNYTEAGNHTIVVSASDGQGSDTFTWTLIVNNTNRAVALDAIPAQTMTEDTAFSLTITANDSDTDDTLVYGENTSLFAIDTSTGVISFTPDNDDAAIPSKVYNVNITVTDGVSTDWEVVDFTVNNVEDAPVLSNIGSQTALTTIDYVLEMSASDADNSTITYNVTNLTTVTFLADGALNFTSSTGVFNLSANASHVGTYLLNFSVTDGNTTSDDSEIVNITIIDSNTAPNITSSFPSSNTPSINEGSSQQFWVTVYDNETTPGVAWYVDDVFNNSDTSWTFTTDYSSAGSYTIKAIVSDGEQSVQKQWVLTVLNVNRDPILSAIADQTATEDQEFSLTISASDADGDSLTFYDNTSLFNINPLTGAITFTPTNAQSTGDRVIKISVADQHGAIDTQDVTFTVQNTNDAPVLSAVGPQTAQSDVLFTRYIYASDIDLGITGVTESLTYSDDTSLFDVTTINSTLGVINFTPSRNDIGTHFIRISVTDSSDAVSNEYIFFDVLDSNSPPVFTNISLSGAIEDNLTSNATAVYSITETTAALTFNSTAYDPDGSQISTTWKIDDVLVSSTSGYVFTPSYTSAGNYTLVLNVTDGLAYVNRTYTIHVSNVNRDPTISALSNQSLTEDTLFTYQINGTDADNEPLTYAINDTRIPIDPQTGLINFTPTQLLLGKSSTTKMFELNVTVKDNVSGTNNGEVSAFVNFTLTNVNDEPEQVANVPDALFFEDQTFSINLSYYFDDPENDTLTYGVYATPVNITTTKIGSDSYNLTPAENFYGENNITFNVSDGALEIESNIVILTVQSMNDLPSINTSNNNLDIYLNEDSGTTSFNLTGNLTDLETPLSSLVLSISQDNRFSTELGSAVIEDKNITFTLASNAYGNDTILLRVTDADGGYSTATMFVNITNTADVPSAPSIDLVPDNATANDNLTCNITANSTDPDGDTVSYVREWYSGANVNSLSLQSDLTGNETITSSNTSGSEVWRCNVYATDGTLNSSTVSDIIITDNTPPTQPGIVIHPSTTVSRLATYTTDSLICNVTTTSNDTGIIYYNYTWYKDGLEQTSTRTTVSFVMLSSGSTSKDEQWRCGVKAEDDQGSYSQPASYVTRILDSTPTVDSRSPSDDNVTITEGQNTTFIYVVADADNDAISYAWELDDVAVSSVSNYTYSASYTSAGVHVLEVVASDGINELSASWDITVTEVARAPVISTVLEDTITVFEDESYQVDIVASDPDGDALTFYDNTGLFDIGQTSGRINFTATQDHADTGSYSVIITVTDGNNNDTLSTTFSIVNINDAPVLRNIGDQTARSDRQYTLRTSASDDDGDTMTYSMIGLDASYLNVSTGILNFTPSREDIGTSNVTIIVSDGNGGQDSETFSFTVLDSNHPPFIVSATPNSSNVTINELESQTFGIVASDPDNTTPSITWYRNGTLIAGEIGNTFTFTSNYSDAGDYLYEAQASDGIMTVTQSWILTVLNLNRDPFFNDFANQNLTEDIAYSMTVTAVDPDGNDLRYYSNSTYFIIDTDNGTISFTPTQSMLGYNESVSEEVGIFAEDGNGGFGSTSILFTINNVNDAPVLSPVGTLTVLSGETLSMQLSATDVDSLSLSYADSGFDGFNMNNSGYINHTFTAQDLGSHEVLLTVDDGDGGVDAEVVIINVLDSNQYTPSVDSFTPASNLSINETESVAFTVSTSDGDGTTPTIRWLVNNEIVKVETASSSTYYYRTTYDTGAGTNNITVNVSDGSKSSTETRAVTVLNKNRAPIIIPLGNQYVIEDNWHYFRFDVVDPDEGDTLFFHANSTLFEITSIGENIIEYSFFPTQADVGVHEMTARAMDGTTVTTLVFNITVVASNDDPIITTIPALFCDQDDGTDCAYDVEASDSDDTDLIYEAFTDLFTINPSTGAFSFDDSNVQAGYYEIMVRVSDDEGAFDFDILRLFIADTNEYPRIDKVMPTNSTQNISESESIDFVIDAWDPDGNVPTVTWLVDDVTQDRQALQERFTFRTNYTQSGTYTITARAYDGNYANTTSWTVIVNNVRDSDNDYIPDYYPNTTLWDNCRYVYNPGQVDLDDDNEGDICENNLDGDTVPDDRDNVLGDANNLQSDSFDHFSLHIGGGDNLNQEFDGSNNVRFFETEYSLANGAATSAPLIDMDFNFSNGTLDMGNFSMDQQAGGASEGSFLAQGFPSGETKTIYVDSILEDSTVCIEDAEITSIASISTGCAGANEYNVTCNGTIVEGNGTNYTCSYDSTLDKYYITGLQHSGVIEVEAVDTSGDGDDDTTTTTGGGGGGGGGGSGGGGASQGGNGTAKIYFTMPQGGQYYTKEVHDDLIAITEVELYARETTGNAVLTIAVDDSFNLALENVIIYQVLTMDLTSDDLVNPKITFTVPKSWTNEMQLDKNTISLYSRIDGVWTPGETVIRSENNNNITYVTQLDTIYSLVLIGGLMQTIEEPEPVEEVREAIVDDESEKKGLPALLRLPNKTVTALIWFIVLLLILIITGIILNAHRRKREREIA